MLFARLLLLPFCTAVLAAASVAFDYRGLINRWRTLHLQSSKEEADQIICNVLLLRASNDPRIEKELRLAGTVERILARLAGAGRLDIIPTLLARLAGADLDERKLNACLWRQLTADNVDAFLDGIGALAAHLPSAAVFPLDTERLLQLPTGELAVVLGFLFEEFPGLLTEDGLRAVRDLTTAAVQGGHVLPPSLLEQQHVAMDDIDQGALFESALNDDCDDDAKSDRLLAICEQFKDRFAPMVSVYDRRLGYELPLPALFLQFYLRDDDDDANADSCPRWEALFHSSLPTWQGELNAVFRAFCRLPNAPIRIAASFLQLGAYPTAADAMQGDFPALNAVLAGNEDLAVFLFDQMPHLPGLLQQVDRRTGVNLLQAALYHRMPYLIRKLTDPATARVALLTHDGAAGDESMMAVLQPWQAQMAREARLFDVPHVQLPFDPDLCSNQRWPAFRASLAAYRADELHCASAVVLLTAAVYQCGYWVLRWRLRLQAVWVRLPGSGVLAVLRRDDRAAAVVVDELYWPRDLALRCLLAGDWREVVATDD